MDEHVLRCLEATLSPEEHLRRGAEDQLKQLFLHPGEIKALFKGMVSRGLDGGSSLARLLLSDGVKLSQRQICFTSTRWQLD